MQQTKVYQLGIRDKKQWDKWYWSPQFPTAEACVQYYAAWLAKNPGRVFTIRYSTVYVNQPVEASK